MYIIFVFKVANSKYILITFNVIQSLVDMQYNNSLYKLTKLFIDYDTESKDDKAQSNNIQTTYFTRIGVWGRFLAQMIMFAMVIPSFVIMKQKYTGFYFVQYLLIAFVIIYGVIMYYFSSKVARLFSQNPGIYGQTEKEQKLLMQNSYNSSMTVNHSQSSENNAWYFCQSFRFLFIDNKITRNGIINVILVFLLSDLMSSYEPLTIAGVNTDSDNETLDNFCGNFLTNLMYQNVFSSVFIAIGAVLYIYVLLPFTDSFHFYRYIYPITSVLVGVGIFVISGFDTNIDNQTVLSLSLGFILAFFTYAHQYDDFLNLGYINVEAVGFYQIIYAWSNNIWQIFGYLFLYLNVLNVAVATMIAILLISSVVQSLYFSRLFKPKWTNNKTNKQSIFTWLITYVYYIKNQRLLEICAHKNVFHVSESEIAENLKCFRLDLICFSNNLNPKPISKTFFVSFVFSIDPNPISNNLMHAREFNQQKYNLVMQMNHKNKHIHVPLVNEQMSYQICNHKKVKTNLSCSNDIQWCDASSMTLSIPNQWCNASSMMYKTDCIRTAFAMMFVLKGSQIIWFPSTAHA